MVHANLTSYIVPKQQTFPLDHWPRFYFSIKQECFSIDLLRFCSTDFAYLYVLNPYVLDLSQEKKPKMFLFVLPKLSWHIIFMEPCVQKQLLESGFYTIANNLKQTFKNRKRHQSCFGEN